MPGMGYAPEAPKGGSGRAEAPPGSLCFFPSTVSLFVYLRMYAYFYMYN